MTISLGGGWARQSSIAATSVAHPACGWVPGLRRRAGAEPDIQMNGAVGDAGGESSAVVLLLSFDLSFCLLTFTF